MIPLDGKRLVGDGRTNIYGWATVQHSKPNGNPAPISYTQAKHFE